MASWAVGDRIWCRWDLTGKDYNFEAVITGVGDNYLRVDHNGQTKACYPKDAVLLKSADGTREQLNLLTKKRGGARPGAGRRKGEVSPWMSQPTKSARFPEEFLPALTEIARQMDWGEWRGPGANDEIDRTESGEKLERIKKLLESWNAQAVGKRAKYDRSWGKALNLLADLNAILSD